MAAETQTSGGADQSGILWPSKVSEMKGKKDKDHLNQSALNASCSSKETHSTASSSAAATELSFPDVTPIDHIKCCPRYTSILNRAAGDGVGIEEMDTLQMELESMLVNAMQRTRLLKLETMILDNTNIDKATAELMRLNNSGLVAKTPTAESKQTSLLKKEKSFSHAKSASSTPNKFTLNENAAPIVRNDIPDTFWQSVEPYCADITDEDIKYLESQIEFYDKSIAAQLQLGPVGKHFSMQWAEEDIGQQIKEGSRFLDLDSTPAASGSHKRKYAQMSESGSSRQALVNHLVDESAHKFGVGLNGARKSTAALHGVGAAPGEKKYYGPLTQRLISALIEQNLITPFESEIHDFVDTIGCSSPSKASKAASARKSTAASPVKAAGFASAGGNLEKRLKRSLFEQGLLLDAAGDSRLNGGTDFSTDDDVSSSHNGGGANGLRGDDDIAAEIKLISSEIKLVSEQCKRTLSQLLVSARKTVSKQNIRKKMAALDAEINEIYAKFKSLRQAKKPATKKDRDKAIKLLKERELLRSQLHSEPAPSLSLAAAAAAAH